MTLNNNNMPLCVEEQVYQEKKIIPQGFVELTTHGKNYLCSTEG
jgi:hypothetical protein